MAFPHQPQQSESPPSLSNGVHRDYDPSMDIEQVTNASAAGQLNEVHRLLSKYISMQLPDVETGQIDLRLFSPALSAAVTNHHKTIVSYLLFMRLPLTCLPTTEAIRTKSSSIFQTFLDYGWDINEPMSRITPPALAYVDTQTESNKILLIARKVFIRRRKAYKMVSRSWGRPQRDVGVGSDTSLLSCSSCSNANHRTIV